MSSSLTRARPRLRRRFATARARTCWFLAGWLVGCTDGRGDSDPSDTHTADCADGYDVESFVAEQLGLYCDFLLTCDDANGTKADCMESLARGYTSTPCYQPCNARACIEALRNPPDCTSYLTDVPLICEQIVQCPDTP